VVWVKLGKCGKVRLGGRGKKMMCDGDGTNKDWMNECEFFLSLRDKKKRRLSLSLSMMLLLANGCYAMIVQSCDILFYVIVVNKKKIIILIN
jgi:hypothetical protein